VLAPSFSFVAQVNKLNLFGCHMNSTTKSKYPFPATCATIRATMTTAEAAAALNRKPTTLTKWAWAGTGPIKPIRIYGRLAWPSDEIAALLNGGQQ
jgi:hypothetical protein